jgi:hypothetical protein
MKKTFARARLYHRIEANFLVRRFATLLVVVSLISVTMTAQSSLRTGFHSSTGFVTVSGTLKVNGQVAQSGQTLFPKSSLITFPKSESLISFQNGVRMKLGEKTDLTVDSSPVLVSGSLYEGQIQIFLPAGVSLDLKTLDASIVSDDTESLLINLQARECGTEISVQQGKVKLCSFDQTRTVKAGESFSSVFDSSQTPAQHNFSRRKRIGLFVGIGAAIAVILGVVLGRNNENQQTPGGGCVIVLSPTGGPNPCL